MRRNIILMSMLACGMLQAENALQIVPTKLTDGTGTLDVQVVSESRMSACQLDISLPNGLTLGTVTTGEKTNANHTVLSRELGAATREGYHAYRLLLYSTNNGSFAGENGQVISMAVSGTIEDGTYPVYVENAILDNAQAGNSHLAININAQSSYLTVGNPVVQSVVLEGNVPSYVVEAINTDVSVTTIDLRENPTLGTALTPANPNAIVLTDKAQGYRNEVIEGKCENFVLTDGYIFDATSDFTATNATYTRAGQTYQWGTLCLPYDVESDANVQYYTLASSNATSLVFKKVDAVEAGTPTLYKIQGEADVESGKYAFSASGSSCTITTTGKTKEFQDVPKWSMHGSYETRKGVTGIYYISKNQFWYATKPVIISPFRAWFECSEENAADARFSITEMEEIEDEVTKLNIVEDEFHNSVEVYFDLNGRRIVNKREGIQIGISRKNLQK